MQYCTHCGRAIEDWDSGYYVRGLACQACYESRRARENKEICNGCYSYAAKNKDQYLLGKFYCDRCYKVQKEILKPKMCKECGRLIPDNEKRKVLQDGSVVCGNCLAGVSKKAAMRIRIDKSGTHLEPVDGNIEGWEAGPDIRLPQEKKGHGVFYLLAKKLLARA
ncbi:MAG: hypothetical protein WC506_02375 [Candidatus Micrarchaeia archaeon]